MLCFISGIKFFFVPQDEILSAEVQLQDRFSAQSSRNTEASSYNSHNINQLRVFDTSQSSASRVVKICDTDGNQDIDQEEDTENAIEILPGATFIACIYNNKWWLGLVKQVSEEYGDYSVSFIHLSGEAKQYFWRDKEDSCWVEKTSIICNLQSPAISKE